MANKFDLYAANESKSEINTLRSGEIYAFHAFKIVKQVKAPTAKRVPLLALAHIPSALLCGRKFALLIFAFNWQQPKQHHSHIHSHSNPLVQLLPVYPCSALLGTINTSASGIVSWQWPFWGGGKDTGGRTTLGNGAYYGCSYGSVCVCVQCILIYRGILYI